LITLTLYASEECPKSNSRNAAGHLRLKLNSKLEKESREKPRQG